MVKSIYFTELEKISDREFCQHFKFPAARGAVRG